MKKLIKTLGFVLLGFVLLVFILIKSDLLDLNISKAKWENLNLYQASNKDIKSTLAKYTNIDSLDLDTVFEKKYVFINFWEPNCGPCLKEIPILVKTQEKYKDSLSVIGITSFSDSLSFNTLKKRDIMLNYKNYGSNEGIRSIVKKTAALQGFEVDTLIDFIPFSILLLDKKIVKVYSSAVIDDELLKRK